MARYITLISFTEQGMRAFTSDETIRIVKQLG